MFTFFIAAPRKYQPTACALAADLRRLGHRVTSSWHDGPHIPEPSRETHAEKQRSAIRNVLEINWSNVLILLTPETGDPPQTSSHMVELGLALGCHRRTIWVGDDANIYDSLPLPWLHRLNDIPELFSYIENHMPDQAPPGSFLVPPPATSSEA